ncbi:hypothetical protein O3G_MSEX007586 [Manduca sexta]|uniref:Retrovirus-related Pol polyprotein from type-1 retrotransposable element R1 n=1 Tax=Manduca sexta TaxID=7130 RepID=A0A921Z7J5_MANSE|nr:hypothetical protein O3G_MSEX007586 [Manduca sexta]
MDALICPEFTTTNIVVVRIRTSAWEVVAVSCYFEPDRPVDKYLDHLRGICQKLGSRRLLVGGDTNAKSLWWSREVDRRGEEVSDWLDEAGLHVLNEGTMPTFFTVRGDRAYSSQVDITACSDDLLDKIQNWKVEEDLTSSDHNTITFKIILGKKNQIKIERTTRKYNTKKANWEEFRKSFKNFIIAENINAKEIDKITDTEQLEKLIREYTKIVINISDKTIPEKNKNLKYTIPWWSKELDRSKSEMMRRKRRIRWAAPVRKERVIRLYKEAKSKYEEDVKKAQTRSWKEFCGRQDKEGLWDGIYRVIGRLTKRHEDQPLVRDGKFLGQEESARFLADTFYPDDPDEVDNEDHRRTRELATHVNGRVHGEIHDPPFTMRELTAALVTFNPKKAPGSDGLTSDICAQAISLDPESFLSLANKCLELAYFPKIWKEATVVVLRKPGREDYTVPKAHRPIGLLPVMGKILEKMLVGRLKWHLIPRMCHRQFGFMPQRGTEDSLYVLMKRIRTKLEEKRVIIMISLDIEGAFDSAWWPAIKVRLAEEQCPPNIRRLIASYLDDRSVRVRYAGAEARKRTVKGCVQGSIGGPILWNLLLDPLLQGLERRGDYCQAFADDVVLVFDGGSTGEAQRQANAALAYVHDWGIRNKLKFAPHKTMAMVITNKLKYDTPILRMGGVDIGMSNEIKVLGLTIDRKLTFNSHVSQACRKAAGLYKMLARSAKVQWGLGPEVIRTIYTAAVEPVILYAASAWAPASQKLGVRKQLGTIQRSFAQKLTKAYRTASLNSTLLLAGILPLDIRVRETALLYEVKRGYSQRVVGDREIEAPVAFASLDHPAERSSGSFQCLVDGAELAQHVGEGLSIFTDGSKIDGKVGAALSIWNGAAETSTRKLRLEPYCSVYQAELLALRKAVEEALHSGLPTCGIFSDARSALEVVTSGDSLHPIAFDINSLLKEASKRTQKIKFLWVKAHVGLEGNERADELAKAAALHLKTRAHYGKCPVSFVKREIRRASIDEWSRRYADGETASTTKLSFQTPPRRTGSSGRSFRIRS